MAKMMFLIVKRQWRQHQQQLTALFAVCGHKQNYFVDQASVLARSLYKYRRKDLFVIPSYAMQNGA